MSRNCEEREAISALLRETAVVVGALADARRRAHSSCTDPDCTPRAVFGQFNQLIELAAGLETLALSWALTADKAHPTAEERHELARLSQRAGTRLGETLRRVAMGEADA